MADTETENAVDSILAQLKGINTPTTRQEIKSLSPADLEKFVLDNSSALITKSLEALDEFRDFLTATPTDASAEALANLINASASAIETLNKILINNKKAETAEKLKQMDINARNINNQRDNATRILMTREDVMKLLNDADKALDVESQILESKPIEK